MEPEHLQIGTELLIFQAAKSIELTGENTSCSRLRLRFLLVIKSIGGKRHFLPVWVRRFNFFHLEKTNVAFTGLLTTAAALQVLPFQRLGGRRLVEACLGGFAPTPDNRQSKDLISFVVVRVVVVNMAVGNGKPGH